MARAKSILITGASGLIGTRLTQLLRERGYHVSHLVRSKPQANARDSYTWNVEQSTIDPHALESADTIIHLAGAGVAEKRWTAKRKKEILESRIQATRLLFEALRDKKTPVTAFITASGVGFYGSHPEKIFTETDGPGNDFLAHVTRQWESEVDSIAGLGVRVVKFRIGVVLSREGGALRELVRPVRWFVGAPLGSGKQWVSWIHIDDLCYMFIRAIEEPSMRGVYNASGPHPVTNAELISAIANVLGKPLLLPPVPEWVLRIMLGEMAEMITRGSKVSSEKISHSGYDFKFKTLSAALQDLL